MKTEIYKNTSVLLIILATVVWQLVLCVPTYEKSLHQHTNKISEQNDSEYLRAVLRYAKAADVQNYMNESVDPCSDFYKFACGRWSRVNPADFSDHISTGLFELLTKSLDRKATAMLSDGISDTDNEIDKKVKKFYDSCMKLKDQQAAYKVQLLEIIKEFGGMPALGLKTWNEREFDWLETIARIGHKYGKTIILGLDIMADFVNNTVNRVYIGYGDFPLESRAMYVDAENAFYRKQYTLVIKRELMRYLGMVEEAAMQTAVEILDFEIALAHGMPDEKLGLGLDELSELTTLEAMQRKYMPTIDIKKLVNITLGEVVTEPVYEFTPEFQRNLAKVITKTPKRIVANYIIYTLLDDFFLDADKKEPKQQNLCVAQTKKYFPKNIDNMIYRTYNSNATELDVVLIWKELKETFRAQLLSEKFQWIDMSTRQLAAEKLDAMRLEINSYTNTNFSEEFGELVTHADNYVENVKNLLALETKQTIEKLHKPPEPIDAGEILSYTPANILLENVIKVPISLLQPYYLWASIYPHALKFGNLGALIGHELIHGFDDTGRKYDKHGNNMNWWDDESTQSFIKRTKCFTSQYSKYNYDGHYLPESASQSENIADNGGLRLSYAAYLRWYENAVRSGQNLQLETLPNLNYTSKQLFFISFAQVWCNDVFSLLKRLQTATDDHVPGKFRVIGTLANFPEFAKEFHCATGTTMNPVKKCQIY